MDYVGGNVIFQINETSSNIGCVSMHSVAQWGNLGFFLSDSGFMKIEAGGAPIPIGEERVNRWFSSEYGARDWVGISTAIDPVLDRWATLPVAAQIAFSGVTRSILLDEQDPIYGTVDDDIDGAGLPSLDDTSYRGGDPRLWVIDDTGRLGALTGSPMTARFTGSDIELFRGKRANLRFARPDIDAVTGVSLELSGKQRLGDPTAAIASSTMMASGDMPLRFSGRYMRPSWTITGGTAWTYFTGAEFIGAAGAGK